MIFSIMAAKLRGRARSVLLQLRETGDPSPTFKVPLTGRRAAILGAVPHATAKLISIAHVPRNRLMVERDLVLTDGDDAAANRILALALGRASACSQAEDSIRESRSRAASQTGFIKSPRLGITSSR